LIVSDIQWDPEEPQEGDIVNIVAKIANVGKGPNRQGFLTGFYIDNKYMGYVRVDESINPGESIDVPLHGKRNRVFMYLRLQPMIYWTILRR